MQAMSSKEHKFYTIIEGVPDDLNREQLLSLTAHISKVLSLVMLRVHSRSGQVHRVGIVEVADNESIFRLTSRKFLVGPGKVIRFRMVSPGSKLVSAGLGQHISLKATYSSSDRSVFSSVVELLGRQGEASLVSMKGQAGLHELVFRVPRSYSLRDVTTDLSIPLAGCLVKLEYPESEFAIDYFQSELAFLEPADPLAHLKAKSLVSEEARFFHPSPEPAEVRTQAHKVGIWNNTYHIHNDELSEDEDCLEEEYQEQPEEDRRQHHPSAGLAFFNNSSIANFMQNRGVLIKPAGHMSQTGAASHSHFQTLDRNRDLPPSLSLAAQADSRRAEGVRHQPPAPGWPAPTPSPVQAQAQVGPGTATKKKPKKAKKKPVHGTAVEEVGPAGTAAAPNSESVQGPGVGALAVGTAANPSPSADQPPTRDGSKLLERLCPPCPDLPELNQRLMPEVMEKWRRFAEIKNDMRKERYLEYLQAKKREAEQLDRASDVDSTDR